MATEHGFTPMIRQILKDDHGELAEEVFQSSYLIQYLNLKTKSANRGSKSRGAFANHYAIFVLVEDYLAKQFDIKEGYDKYAGARYTDLFNRQRELPFGNKLQNHALNNRMNHEFKKWFSQICTYTPILLDEETKRYWINENLLKLTIGGRPLNIARSIIKIIDAYVEAKKDAFEGFIASCEKLQKLQHSRPKKVRQFIADLLQPNVDARIFEIVSFSILKEYYSGQVIFWGWSRDEIDEEELTLYKTGRTNANDGGIDFVMKPLGRFFQVTETTDVRKYFLDIDKVHRFPITFVVKALDSVELLLKRMRSRAKEVYSVEKIVERYMKCVEEIINLPKLLERFDEVVQRRASSKVIDEIVLQSKLEFNYQELEASE